MDRQNLMSDIGVRQCAIRRYLAIFAYICIIFFRSLFAVQESVSIVGYQTFEIKKGWTWLEMPFTDVGGKYFSLDEILKAEAAREGDVVYYYTLTPTNVNIMLEAIVEQTDSGLHFFQVSAKRWDNGYVSRAVNHAISVDNFILLPSLPGSKAKVRIRYLRKGDEVTCFTLSGMVAPIILEVSKIISDMGSLADWIKNRICYEVYKDSLDSVVSIMAEEDGLLQGRSFVDELLECARKTGPVYFYAYFKGREDAPTQVLFNPINGKFTNMNSSEMLIDTSVVRRFGTVEDEFSSDKIDAPRRLPVDIVEEMNRLLDSGFFDDKELFWVVRRDGSTRMVTYDKVSSAVIDCKMGAAYNLKRDAMNQSRDDIVGFSDVPVPTDRTISPPPIVGKGRYLTHAEVKYLESILMPKHHYTLWGSLAWLLMQAFQIFSTVFFGHIISPSVPKVNRYLMRCFYFLFPVGPIKLLIEHIVAKRRARR